MNAELPVSAGSGQFEIGPARGGEKSPGPSLAPSQKLGRFGNYELLEEITRGGMGIVYKARQLSAGRVVALKMVLQGHLASEEVLNRFQIEANAAAGLTHTNIVPIYDVGEVEGVPYFSMRLIEGGNLARFSAECGVRNAGWIRRAAALVAKIAGAVHYAHQHLVLHRDIKPSNILLDAQGEPYLTDFGLARLVARASDLTVSGAVVGTPDYMAPEQAQGGTKDLTTAADVFSLGAVFYELLTGQAPFHGQTDLETRRKVAEEEATKPSAINRAVNRDLQTICLKCLEKDPRHRYSSAQALAQDLERWQNDEPIQARPPGPATRAIKWTRRHRVVTAVAAVVLLSLAGYTITTRIDAGRLRRALAESLLHEGEALAANHHPAEAKERIVKSRSLSIEAKTTTLPAELSLADVYRFSPPPLMTLRGHRGKATCVAVASDQRTLFSGGEDGTIRIWSCPLGRQEAVRDAHPGGVACLALSPDGRFCVSGGTDKKIRIWDARKATPVRTIESQQERVSALCFAPNGDTFASASWDRTIRIWRLSSGAEVQVLRTDFDRIPNIAFSPDGHRVVAESENGGFGIWKLDDPGGLAVFMPYRRGVSVAWTPDGGQIVHGNMAGEFGVMDLVDASRNRGIRLTSAVTGLGLLPPGKRAIAGTDDGTLAILDLSPENPVLQLELSEHDAAVTAVAAFPDGRLAASSSEDGTIRVWDALPAEEKMEGLHPVCSVVFSPDGLLFLSSGHGGQLDLWDAATGNPLMDYVGHDYVVLDAAFAPDGRRAVSCGQDGTVRIWDVAGGAELRRFRSEHRTVCSVGFSADGRLILGGEAPEDYPASKPDPSEWFRLHVWEADTGRERCKPIAHRGGVLALAISPDGRSVLTGGGDGKMKLWDPASGRVLRSFDADQNLVRSIAFGPGGEQCVSAGSQRALRIWNVRTGREINFLRIKEEPSCLSVCGANSLMLAGMDSGNLGLWDLATGRELHRFITGHQQGVSGGAYSAMLWHLDRGAAWHRFEEAASKARATLQHNPHDGAALRALAEWYEFRRLWDWASELFEQARANGADVPCLSLARCLWQGRHLEQARNEVTKAANRKDAPGYYLQLCSGAISRQIDLENAPGNLLKVAVAPGPDAVVCQPGSSDGKDIWTTSKFSNAPGGETPGGGKADDILRVGGWGDWYYSLLQFNLAGMPTNARAAVLYLYCGSVSGGGTRMYLDRVAQAWDWKTSGTGRDHERLWWADRPKVALWRTDTLPAPVAGQWYAVELTDLYNAWQSGACTNCGVQFRPEKVSNEYFNKFYSSRYTNDPSLRPKLIVTAPK
jgi:WD40 repeat protein